MTVCNACRYCEQYCPVFPAMELRRTFDRNDLNYLANLCHNCGECLYACQYAPPHEFGINVPHTLAKIRVRSYEEYAWPRPLAVAFRRHGLATALLLAAAMSALMLLVALAADSPGARLPGPGDFYAVLPHGVMVTLFGGVGLFVVLSLGISLRRFTRDVNGGTGVPVASGLEVASRFSWKMTALRDVLTLRHLHATGEDCVTAEENRTPWRRWFHHATFYGFLLCFASTTVAAIYHTLFGWEAPYSYTSLPVVLGTAGGVGLIVGPAGLWLQRGRRDPALTSAAAEGLDRSFVVLLLLTSATGLALLVLRTTAAMSTLLIVHLGMVLALFLTLPYGKFVHGLYRAAALVKAAGEGAARSGSR
jgi:citrate/tricarballylate utilization protein